MLKLENCPKPHTSAFLIVFHWQLAIPLHKYRSNKIRFSLIFLSNHHHISLGDFFCHEKEITPFVFIYTKVWAFTHLSLCVTIQLQPDAAKSICGIIYIKCFLLFCCCKGSNQRSQVPIRSSLILYVCTYISLWSLILKLLITVKRKGSLPVFNPHIFPFFFFLFFSIYILFTLLVNSTHHGSFNKHVLCSYVSHKVAGYTHDKI